MVKVFGQVRKKKDNMPSDCPDPEWADFEVISVALDKIRDPEHDTGAGGDDEADVTFYACLSNCDDEESCKAGKDEGLELCPNSEKPEHWDAELPNVDPYVTIGGGIIEGASA